MGTSMTETRYPRRRRCRPVPSWPTALVIHSDQDVRNEIHFALEVAGFSVRSAAAAEVGRVQLASCNPDLVLIHLPFPRRRALDLLRGTPPDWTERRAVVAIASGGDQVDRAVASALGVQACLPDGRSIEALMLALRGHVLLRSKRAVGGYFPALWWPFFAGSLLIHVLGRYAETRGRRQRLTVMELRVLLFLAENSRRPCTESDLREKVWRTTSKDRTRRVHTMLKTLRDLFRDHGNLIDRIPGSGFQLSRRFAEIVPIVPPSRN